MVILTKSHYLTMYYSMYVKFSNLQITKFSKKVGY